MPWQTIDFDNQVDHRAMKGHLVGKTIVDVLEADEAFPGTGFELVLDDRSLVKVGYYFGDGFTMLGIFRERDE